MAMQHCPDCNRWISTRADECPQCGRVMPVGRMHELVGVQGLSIVFVLYFLVTSFD